MEKNGIILRFLRWRYKKKSNSPPNSPLKIKFTEKLNSPFSPAETKQGLEYFIGSFKIVHTTFDSKKSIYMEWSNFLDGTSRSNDFQT